MDGTALIGANASEIARTLYQLKAEQEGRDVVVKVTDRTQEEERAAKAAA